MGRLFVLGGALLLLSAAASVQAFEQVTPRLREAAITLDVQPAPGLKIPIVDPPTRVSGYFKLDRTYAAEMFYFFYAARKNPTTSPLVVWMTGGPGCSSELAVLYEQGPYTFAPNHTKTPDNTWLMEREYGWDVYNNMIFVDQPVGTGFSYTDDSRDTVYDEKGVADDMLDFLWEFFKAHPDLAGLPLYITGESYAGHYVPAVSHRVYLANKNNEGPKLNLQGLAVGNGLTSPSIQFAAYGDFAQQNGLISQATRSYMGFFYPLCALANSWCESTNWSFICALGLTYCMATQFQPILEANIGINVYDITKQCDGRLCYDFTEADEFLNAPNIKKALGVDTSIEWVGCNYDVYQHMSGDWLHRFDTVLPEMMADGIRVMIYAGDLDLICNWLGNRRWVDSLQWDGSADWAATTDKEWKVMGKSAGLVREAGPLSFVRVYKAGHMVPMDQALNSLAMITAFSRGKSLLEDDDEPQQVEKATTVAAALNAEMHPTRASAHAWLDRLATPVNKAPVSSSSSVAGQRHTAPHTSAATSTPLGGAFLQRSGPRSAFSRMAGEMVSRLRAAAARSGKRAECAMHNKESNSHRWLRQ